MITAWKHDGINVKDLKKCLPFRGSRKKKVSQNVVNIKNTKKAIKIRRNVKSFGI